jgi:ribosomal protein S27E
VGGPRGSSRDNEDEMLTIDCPLCAGEATTDDALTFVACDGCGVTEVAPDPVRWLADAA